MVSSTNYTTRWQKCIHHLIQVYPLHKHEETSRISLKYVRIAERKSSGDEAEVQQQSTQCGRHHPTIRSQYYISHLVFYHRQENIRQKKTKVFLCRKRKSDIGISLCYSSLHFIILALFGVSSKMKANITKIKLVKRIRE